MIRRLTKRTELEIVAQWPNDGDITDDATTAYVTSLLEDCSPDADSGGKLSTRAPEELMRILASYGVSVPIPYRHIRFMEAAYRACPRPLANDN